MTHLLESFDEKENEFFSRLSSLGETCQSGPAYKRSVNEPTEFKKLHKARVRNQLLPVHSFGIYP
jgi:hypothetical protein